MIVFRYFFLRTWKIPYTHKIPYTPTLYRTVPYTKNPVPYIVYGTVYRGHPEVTVPNFFYFDEIWRKKMAKKLSTILIFTNFSNKVKKCMFFLALPPSFFILHQNKKNWNSNLNHFHQLLFHIFFHPMNHFFGFNTDFKTKIGCRTEKSAANDANILVGCISNPKNIYFEVCMIR